MATRYWVTVVVLSGVAELSLYRRMGRAGFDTFEV